MVEGTVRFWRDEKGWGVIDSPETPGGCWVHFSSVEGSGSRTLAEGQPVELEWEIPRGGVYEGYRYFARRVAPH